MEVEAEANTKEDKATNAVELPGVVPLEDGVPEGHIPNEEFRVGGRLVHFKKRWTFSPWAHSIVSKGLGWSWKTGNPPRLQKFFQKPTRLLKSYVKDLLSRLVIKKINKIKFQGLLFCVPKRDTNRKRVILDLSVLN